MALYFECAVRYDKTLENGSVRKVTDKYLVDALSFTEAETRLIEAVTPGISGEFSIPSIKKTKIAEVFNTDADRFFLAKVAFITLDEKTGVEKKSVSQILVGACDMENANINFEDGMKGTLSDFELVSLAETGIIGVISHNSEKSK